ncbi:nucleoside-diphosphate kinase [Streptantibioticus silvisoli]|uniref:Nucleoside-diphosphate kinase n=1 Tax=Streptantibioticus silvisoli TaxID=2705255 RepID=A0ABT6VV15_9ACTN|nr:nucleoside-diphosphate kinase [Streptantibioticus silvisoli]MDI5962325.1 nucleoside-diphosphate kinase [Streptantibioticus silvisoli]
MRRGFYPDDIYFCETALLLERESHQRLDLMLRRSSFVMFKPEAVVGRRIGPALAWLAARGFRPTGCARVRVDPRVHRELWRYQLNAASLAIVRTVDMILSAGPCLVVALRDEHGPERTGMTASARLAALKGSSSNPGANGGSLRGELGCELLCLNFLHAPDDPSDQVRELGVLFPARERAAALAMLAADPCAATDAAVAAAVRALYAEHPAHPLDPAAVPAPPATDGSDAALFARLDVLDDPDSDIPHWDRVLMAARLVDGLPSRRRPLIGSPRSRSTGSEDRHESTEDRHDSASKA